MNFSEELKTFVDGIEAPNILIIGRVGVGKSTIINAVFGKSLAAAGVGLGGVTKSYNRYSPDEGVPITVYDSAGFEAGKEDDFLKETFKFLDSKKGQGKNEQIHLAWYVVNAASARFEHFEKSLIERLNRDRIPVIIVLSQCDRASAVEKQGMLRILGEANFEKAYDIVQTAAAPLQINGQPICKPFGLDELVNKTIELLPKAYAEAFVAAQIISIKAKRAVAFNIVKMYAAGCFAAGFIPIPFTTPLSAFFGQKNLAVRLAALFGYDKLKNLPNILEDVTKSREAKTMFIITSIADLFPFELITSTVAGASAATYMLVIGLALASTFEELARLELDGLSRQDIETRLQTVFRQKFDSYRSRIKIRREEDLDRFEKDYVEGD